MCVDITYAAVSTKHTVSLCLRLHKVNSQTAELNVSQLLHCHLAAGTLESVAGFSASPAFSTDKVCALLLQGDAIAGLAAIASANKTRLPEAPLQDSMAARAEQKGLLATMHHARMCKRLLIMLAVSAAASQVGWHKHSLHQDCHHV